MRLGQEAEVVARKVVENCGAGQDKVNGKLACRYCIETAIRAVVNKALQEHRKARKANG